MYNGIFIIIKILTNTIYKITNNYLSYVSYVPKYYIKYFKHSKGLSKYLFIDNDRYFLITV